MINYHVFDIKDGTMNDASKKKSISNYSRFQTNPFERKSTRYIRGKGYAIDVNRSFRGRDRR